MSVESEALLDQVPQNGKILGSLKVLARAYPDLQELLQ